MLFETCFNFSHAAQSPVSGKQSGLVPHTEIGETVRDCCAFFFFFKQCESGGAAKPYVFFVC